MKFIKWLTSANLLILNRDITGRELLEGKFLTWQGELNLKGNELMHLRKIVRYLRYQEIRIEKALREGKDWKALIIWGNMMNKSKSYKWCYEWQAFFWILKLIPEIVLQRTKKDLDRRWTRLSEWWKRTPVIVNVDRTLSMLETVTLGLIIGILITQNEVNVLTESQALVPGQEDIIPQSGWLRLTLWACGVLIAGGILWLILDVTSSGRPDDLIQGPITIEEIEKLHRELSYQAWLDNLAISPIGDLWVSPPPF